MDPTPNQTNSHEISAHRFKRSNLIRKLSPKVFILFVIFGAILGLLLIPILKDLPSPSNLLSYEIPQTTKIFDRNGTLLYDIYTEQNRTLVKLSDIPKYLQMD